MFAHLKRQSVRPLSMALVSLIFGLLCTFEATCGAQEMKYLQTEDGRLACVSAEGFPLAHTTQLVGMSGTDQATALPVQLSSALENVDAALKQSGSSLADAVKLNVYLDPTQSNAALQDLLREKFDPQRRPAIAVVETRLPWADQVVAIDAVGVVRQNRPAGAAIQAQVSPEQIGATSLVCPVGPRVYVSGQAEKGDGSLRDATMQTMDSLYKTLRFLGLDKRDVIQVKCFLNPLSQSADTVAALSEFFGAESMPPCILVEWKSALPIEIELIATATNQTGQAQQRMLEVLTPPGMTTPTIYSRLMVVRHPATIYTDGLYPSDPTASGEAQLRSLFGNLKRLLDLSGSDWTHLVKATYYVSSSELSEWHNKVRPDYFNPRLPPAASKAVVTGVGRAEHGITMDFIMVPGE
jgi:enamine deaminase RidA (YjgF/YER057c/UK114 family)